MKLRTLTLGLLSASTLAFAAHAESITIATVNNGDMVRMQKLTEDFTKANPDIQLNWVTLEEMCCASASPPTSPPRAASTT
jgi:sorbitol/mannitol transport system substrate-binding protein